MIKLHYGLLFDLTYILSFVVADLLWIFNCGIGLALKFHQDTTTIPTLSLLTTLIPSSSRLRSAVLLSMGL